MTLKKHLFTALMLCAAIAGAGDAIDINTAGPEALADAIRGVGLKKAEAIVAYREQNGPFRSVDELAQVRGIGPQMVEGSRARLTVGAKSE